MGARLTLQVASTDPTYILTCKQNGHCFAFVVVQAGFTSALCPRDGPLGWRAVLHHIIKSLSYSIYVHSIFAISGASKSSCRQHFSRCLMWPTSLKVSLPVSAGEEEVSGGIQSPVMEEGSGGKGTGETENTIV